MSNDEQKELDKFLEEQLRPGRIWPSKSTMASPFFFIKTKDRKELRQIQDYRKLNEAMIKNQYPLPLISELIDTLKDVTIFTKLDIHWGYNNIQIKEGDEWKATFCTNRGLFEPTVMFFGLTNSPATFQSFMSHIFWELIHKNKVKVYIDDILKYSRDKDAHERKTKRILQILEENLLYCKPAKCEFDKAKIEYLGLIVGQGKIRMELGKVKAITEWPTPTSKKITTIPFLGFTNFYQPFIRG